MKPSEEKLAVKAITQLMDKVKTLEARLDGLTQYIKIVDIGKSVEKQQSLLPKSSYPITPVPRPKTRNTGEEMAEGLTRYSRICDNCLHTCIADVNGKKELYCGNKDSHRVGQEMRYNETCSFYAHFDSVEDWEWDHGYQIKQEPDPWDDVALAFNFDDKGNILQEVEIELLPYADMPQETTDLSDIPEEDYQDEEGDI